MNIRPFRGHTPAIDPSAYVDPTAVVIGEVSIGAEASLWPMAVVRGDIHAVTIGARSNIQDGAVLHVTHPSEFNPAGYPLTVGEEVIVGHRVVLHGCTIGNRCLIGMGAVILDGAVIEDEVIVGAGALVTQGKRLASGRLYVGNPARALRPLSERERSHLRYSAAHYVRLAREHKEGP